MPPCASSRTYFAHEVCPTHIHKSFTRQPCKKTLADVSLPMYKCGCADVLWHVLHTPVHQRMRIRIERQRHVYINAYINAYACIDRKAYVSRISNSSTVTLHIYIGVHLHLRSALQTPAIHESVQLPITWLRAQVWKDKVTLFETLQNK